MSKKRGQRWTFGPSDAEGVGLWRGEDRLQLPIHFVLLKKRGEDRKGIIRDKVAMWQKEER